MITRIIDGTILYDPSELQKGYGIRMVSIENPDVSVVYWHCLPKFPCKMGDTIMQGQPVVQMGNSGYVLSNGVYVPLADRTKPPYYGTHCHCSVNIDGDDPAGLVDYRDYLDMSIEVKYDLLTAIKMTLNNLLNLWKIY